MPSMGKNADMIRAQKFGFWVGTKATPRVAVQWEPATHDDGRETLRGRNWVEVREHGSTREPERFFGADVETVGPHEWLDYYPEADAPVCGWGRPRLPHGGMQYCPRKREAGEPFCRAHMAELQGEEVHGQAEEAQRPDAH